MRTPPINRSKLQIQLLNLQVFDIRFEDNWLSDGRRRNQTSIDLVVSTIPIAGHGIVKTGESTLCCDRRGFTNDDWEGVQVMEGTAMTPDIIAVLATLSFMIVMLIFEIVRIDIAALICMLSLGWMGVLNHQETFSGFSSNAVISMMAVMILGHGVSKTGAMDRFSREVVKRVGAGRNRIVGFMSLAVGLLSGFIQNIGAVALFLPGILNISRREKIPASRLIMPIGFAAILGGTLSMIGSGPLILINDLIRNEGFQPFSLFSVTPVGIVLLSLSIIYFLLLGKYVLPGSDSAGPVVTEQEKLIEALHLPHTLLHYVIPGSSDLVGMTPEQSGAWSGFNVNILGAASRRSIEFAPWRQMKLESGQVLALLGNEKNILEFAEAFDLLPSEPAHAFSGLNDPERSGFAEVLVPPRSELIGLTIRKYSLRKRYAVEPIMMFSRGEEIRGDISDLEIRPGDTIIVYGMWDKITDLKRSGDFVVATPYSTHDEDRSKTWIALGCFLLAIGLTLSGFPISLAFFTGALCMVLGRVLTIQEAYQAIEWKVVFLLAGLIPLGIAMQKTGTADFLAKQVMILIQGTHPVILVMTVAVLSTLFSLFISNVGAVVVLAPLVMSMARMGGLDPRSLALMAAVCTSNSFILPTHQVNALLMSSGGYRNANYLKAGAGLTFLFLVSVVSIFYVFYF